MKMNILAVLIIMLFAPAALLSSAEIKKDQTETMRKVLKNANQNNYDKAAEIINYIDDVYGSINEQIANDGKFKIYFGPAHGKDNTGRWRGTTTERIGVTGLPEEWYSIIYSRKLYNKLKANKYIEVSAAPYYMNVLEGKSDSYQYMKFRDVADNAYNSNAFLVIEMHMNNVSVFEKADGLVNMPGIHIIRDSSGRKLLKNITGTYSGYLTLYNKYDASGFSKQYAHNIKNSLSSKGYSINNWEYGAVADDRFSYYLLFPVSVIYECGFISHPAEEKKLRDPEYMDEMISTHYDMLVKTINDVFGMDISGSSLKYNPKDVTHRIELLKLARLTVLFLEKGDVEGANAAVNSMKRYYSSSTSDTIDYYSAIIERVNRAEHHYRKGLAYSKKKKYRKSRTCFVNAKNSLSRNIIYSAMRDKYNNAIYGNRRERNSVSERSNGESYSPAGIRKATAVERSSVTKPFILALRSKEGLEHAVSESLGANDDETNRIIEGMKDYKAVSWKKVKKYSSKRKKRIWISEKVVRDFEFTPGIYVVNLDKNLNIVKANRVSAVYLDPQKYQNQQYLKNSYFAETEKQKDI